MQSLLDILMEPDQMQVSNSGPRHFYRCSDCLGVVAVSESTEYRTERGYVAYGTCGSCGGSMEYMGRTSRDRLVKDHLLCPCDDRCTSALGPHCSCRCGGENHGSNMVVAVTRDQGGIPHFGSLNAIKARAEAEYYRGLCAQFNEAWEARYRGVSMRKYAGEYLSGQEFGLYCDSTRKRNEFCAIRDLRTHKARNSKLIKLIATFKGTN